jgi:D-alanyl-D-alanine endopeptidase (penicillin-binding protein 7)
MSAQPLIGALGWTLLHFVWQGALVGCATAVVLTALRNARPERRYLAACAGLLLCLAWPAAELVLALRGGAQAVGIGAGLPGLASRVADGGAAGMLSWLQAHLDWIVGLWTACTAALALRMALGLLWIERAGDATDPAWQARLSTLAARCGLDREVRLRVIDGLSSPVTAGWWRPVVLVPAALLTGMSPQLLEALLAHELGHVQRHDYLVNLVQNVIETLLFYHPAVWWISHRIRIEREQIADDFAAGRLGEPRRLALALSELERLQFSGQRLAQAANGGDLMARIRRLLRPGTRLESNTLDWKAALPVLGLALACAATTHPFPPGPALLALDTYSTAQPGTQQRAARGLSRAAIADFATCAKPEYPRADLDAGHQGTTTVSFLVSAGGRVTDSKIVRSSGYASMDEASRSALTLCGFKPALRDGRAVAQWTSVQYVWTLE